MHGAIILIEAYHAPMFSANVLSVAILSDHYEAVFSKSLKNYPGCFFMCKKTFEIVAEYPLRGGLYSLNLPSITQKAYTIYTRSKKLDEWHQNLGHISSERLLRLSKMAEDVPPFDKEMRKHFESGMNSDGKIHGYLRISLKLSGCGRIFLYLTGKMADNFGDKFFDGRITVDFKTNSCGLE